MNEKDFAVLILTHGRPNNARTFEAVRRHGYTGRIIIVIDNEDKTAEQYKENFDNVEVFDKKEMASRFDECDNFDDRRAIIYARNASFDIAERIGVRFFIQFDDDYTDFLYRWVENGKLLSKRINLDSLFDKMIEFHRSIPNISAIAMAQGGDYIGGANGGYSKKGISLTRKCMNSFLCDTTKRFWFKGRINEDVNTYVGEGNRGQLLFTLSGTMLNQVQTQKNAGGMTDIYLDKGTYVKSFYSVMICPYAVDIRKMGPTNPRLHHHINWECAVPKIINKKYKKI